MSHGRQRPSAHQRREVEQQPAWSPDGRWLAFVSDRSDTRQLYRLVLEGGEAEALTSGAEGVTAFAWSPDGARIAYTMTEPVTAARRNATRNTASSRTRISDHRMAQLHVLDVAAKATGRSPRRVRRRQLRLVAGRPRIAFDHRLNSDAGQRRHAPTSRSSRWRPARHAARTQAGPTSSPRWSPDGAPDRVPVGDGQAVLLLRERRRSPWCRRRRRRPRPSRPLRREPVARRVDTARASSSRRRSAPGRISIRLDPASRQIARPTASRGLDRPGVRGHAAVGRMRAFVASGAARVPRGLRRAAGRDAGGRRS